MNRSLFAAAVLDGAGEAIFSDSAVIQALLKFEAALAESQAQHGIISKSSSDAIRAAAKTFSGNVEKLRKDALDSASLAAPFVKAFTEHVAASDPTAAAMVHVGATTQDAVDTAIVLCTQQALVKLEDSLAHAEQPLRALSLTHASTPMLARSLLQPAGITTVGYVLMQWIDAIARGRERIKESAATALCVSFGGPTGHLSTFGEQGPAIRATMARILGLRDPGFVWHAYRDDWITLAATVTTLGGTLLKIAQDVALCAQAEVNEFSEAHHPGKGSSSALPHKRNPVLTLRVLANALPMSGYLSNLVQCMPQQHQRGFGTWQAEFAQWPLLFAAAVDSAAVFASLAHSLEINAEACRHNIERLNGVIFSDRLADRWSALLGKAEAMKLVTRLCEECVRDQRHLLDLAITIREQRADLQPCGESELRSVFDVEQIAGAIADRVRKQFA